MKLRLVFATLWSLWILLSGSPQSLRAEERYVVLVSVDGLSASYLNDPRAHLPMLRKLASQGTHAGGMVTSFPSITWPSHVSLVTGASPARHGVIGNRVLDRETGEEIAYIGDSTFTKNECVRVPTLYDVVHRAGMRTASVIWPACNGAATLDWMIPDSNQQRLHERYTTPGLAAELDAAGISIAKLGQWGWKHEYSAIRDATYSRVAAYLMRTHRPNLLLVHLITPDGVEHDYGPNVEEAYWACGNADDRIREIWEALQEPPLAGKSTLFVVADHGFATYDRHINPNVLFKEMGLIEVNANDEVSRRRAWCLPSGGSAGVYILDDARRERLKQQLKRQLIQIDGVERVLDVEEFTKLGLPDPAENPQQADLMLACKPGYCFSGSVSGSQLVTPTERRRGTHGHLPDQPFMHAMFVAAGADIKPGAKLTKISNLDVAPTIAAILGVQMPTAEGRVLDEILVQKEK